MATFPFVGLVKDTIVSSSRAWSGSESFANTSIVIGENKLNVIGPSARATGGWFAGVTLTETSATLEVTPKASRSWYEKISFPRYSALGMYITAPVALFIASVPCNGFDIMVIQLGLKLSSISL